MQRNAENKRDRYRKRQEEIDNRLREAGMYEDGLSPEAKAQLLQLMEESCKSARLEEEERQCLQRQEQRIMAETLSKSSMQKESGGSSSRHRTVEMDVEEEVVVSRSAAQHTQQGAKPGPSATCRSSVASPVKSSSGHVATLHTQAEDEDEDLVLLPQEEVDDPECQVIKTSNESPSRGMERLKIAKRKNHESVEEISSTPSQSSPSQVKVSPVIGKSRTTSTNTITSTVMSDDDSDATTVSPLHSPRKAQQQRLPNPHVRLVPLDQTISPRKTVILSSVKEQTSPKAAASTTNSLNFSHVKNISPHSSPLSQKSSHQKSPIFSLTNSPTCSEETVVFTPNSSSHNLSPSGTPFPSKDASIHTSVKKLGTPNISQNSMTSSIRRNITSYFKEDSNLSKNCASPVSSSLGVSIIKSTSSTTTTITTTTTTTTTSTTCDVAHATSTTITTTTSDQEVEDPENSADGLPESDEDDKITLRTAVLRTINVFNPKPPKEVILKRKQPFFSEAADKCYYQGPNESQQQCRSRILALMNDMRVRLRQHQRTLPPLPRPLPITDRRQKHYSLERSRPIPRRIAQRKQLEEEMQREESKRNTRQAAKFSHEALDPVPGPSRTEETTRGHRLGNGRTLGLRRGKKSAIVPLPKVTSDSDSDRDIGCASPPLPSSSQSSLLPCPLKAGDTVPEPKNKVGSQPKQCSKTILLDSGSEGSDNECHVESGAAKSDSNQRLSPEMQRDVAASLTEPPSELCIIEDEQFQPKLARPAIRSMVRRGTRRPMPESTGSVPTKVRKTHIPNTETSTTDRVPEQTNQLSPDSSDLTPSFEDPSEWNTEQRQDREEEQEGEKIPCPICQRLYSMQEIQVHASDCAELEDSQQQELSQGSRRLKRMNEEADAAVVSSNDKSKECNRKHRCNLCNEILNSPEELHRHFQSCHRMEDDDDDNIFFDSAPAIASAVRQTNRRNVKVPGRTLTQEVTRARGALQTKGLLSNLEGKPS